MGQTWLSRLKWVGPKETLTEKMVRKGTPKQKHLKGTTNKIWYIKLEYKEKKIDKKRAKGKKNQDK